MSKYYESPTQVIINDLENGVKHFGIAFQDRIICGCCGGIYELDEVGETFELVKEVTWMNLDSMLEEVE